ncbi:MAG: hypothetical protein SFW65_00060 [Alphaproteobacteria bacterium]|nr:hypothetical protein [Alphaproteobacteria bacterium]
MSSAISGLSSYFPGQSVGQTVNLTSAKKDKGQTDPAEELVKYSQMSAADKIRYQYLRAHNLTEDDLTAMSPKVRADIEKKISEEIRRAMDKHGNTTPIGFNLNITA